MIDIKHPNPEILSLYGYVRISKANAGLLVDPNTEWGMTPEYDEEGELIGYRQKSYEELSLTCDWNILKTEVIMRLCSCPDIGRVFRPKPCLEEHVADWTKMLSDSGIATEDDVINLAQRELIINSTGWKE